MQKRRHSIASAIAWVFFIASQISAATFYVNQAGTNPTPPYSTWATAATNIQDAIDASTNGDIVWVTNGVYQYGGMAMSATLTNRVALFNAISVQSVNGPFVTVIQGNGATNGPNAIRCAWLTNGASLTGFTLQAGATFTSGTVTTSESGGGVWCASSNALVSNCLIVSNTAYSSGGGAFQGTLKTCWLTENLTPSTFGGGATSASMTSCTVVSNSGGGVYQCLCTNCIIYYNASGDHPSAGTYSYCCTTPIISGIGNITVAPQLLYDGIHLSTGSPCIGEGTNLTSGSDIFGRAWLNPPSMGCAEWQPAPIIATPQIKLLGDPVGFTVIGTNVNGQAPFSYFWMDNGLPLNNNGHFSNTSSTNLIATGISLADAGSYQLVASNAFGVSTSAIARLVIHCVDASGANPVAPYLTWATAATNIQNAIDSANAGDGVLVTNGFYATGGRSMDGVITNVVSVGNAITVSSVNGPGSTIIQGAWDPVSTNGPAAVRCAWLTNYAILSGFTLQGGATRTAMPTTVPAYEGGGIWAASTNAFVYNCKIVTNYASASGGGVYSATVSHCSLIGNKAFSVGGFFATGGGAQNCNLRNSLFVSNSVVGDGGAIGNCKATNCVIIQNNASGFGTGVYEGILVNCTVAQNTTDTGQNAAVYSAVLTNCCVYANNYLSAVTNNYYSCTFGYSDTDPLPSGIGNKDINPQFLADGYHLSATSPCIGAGTSSVVSGTDIDGQPWNNPPSIGADEWQPAPIISIPPTCQVGFPAHALTFNAVVAGQSPFTFFWSQNGVPIQDDGHHTNSATANLVVNNFGPQDAGIYQVIVSNAYGTATSQVAQVIIHAVNAAGTSPLAPYTNWITAATNIQDAINAASTGDIVLVTNGVYAFGGAVVNSNLTNRVALTKPLTVISVNGYSTTTIQGAYDPVSTNGPGAVRCAYLANGAVLNGFTLQNGATRTNGDQYTGGPLESGGGVYCSLSNGIVRDCVLTNNSAVCGAGIAYGTLNNSLVIGNLSSDYGGGAYEANLNNCTVVNNYILIPLNNGCGTYGGVTRNSLIAYNFVYYGDSVDEDFYPAANYAYCCTDLSVPGTGNIVAYPTFLDAFHLPTNSPCIGAGTNLYSTGYDLDGEPWNSRPSIGCDEVVVADLTGPITASVIAYQTNLYINRTGFFSGSFTGRVSSVTWSFGDGVTNSSFGANANHAWTNPGSYVVTYTVFNNSNPSGVSVTVTNQVLPLFAPQIQSPTLLTNGFQFQFAAQTKANYTIQYATNLIPPVRWNALQYFFNSPGGTQTVTDTVTTNTLRFYRILVQ